jgi:sporulation integral membrane protein YlbJ
MALGGSSLNKSLLKSIFLGLSVSFLAGSIILFPKASFDASLRGLTTWWEIVFPSLLPFFILSEIMIGYGVVKFIGVLMEPLMRPIFRVPGVGGFVWAMGVSSGFPAGAKITARMRQEKQISAVEAERLVSFTNSSNPVFIFGAIAAALFDNPGLGILLASCHYLGNILVGIFMRFHGEHDRNLYSRLKLPSIKKAIYEMHRTRLLDNRPFGKLLGDSVYTSVNTLLMIGGFMILFSVLNRVMAELQITDLVASFIAILFMFLHISTDLSIPLIAGMLEITLGSQLVSETKNVTLLHQAIIVSFILAFNGFSVQAQVASILSETDIRFKPFFYARILHGVIASVLALLLWEPLYMAQREAIDVFYQRGETILYHEFWKIIVQSGSLITLSTLIIFILLLVNRIIKKEGVPRY